MKAATGLHGLAAEYARQVAWRRWSEVMDLLPALAGRSVLDLGCGIGDQAAELTRRGARVLGVDGNEELLDAARGRGIPNAEFRSGDLTSLHEIGVVDGVWCSFAAAYIPELVPTLILWKQHLPAGGWLALTEIDDLFGHEPVEPRTRELFVAHARATLAAKRYDFHMGGKLRGYLERAGFTVVESRTLADDELAFDGPAKPAVVDAWRARLSRMGGLENSCGAEFEHVREDFLAALAHPEHRSLARVHFCLARC